MKISLEVETNDFVTRAVYYEPQGTKQGSPRWRTMLATFMDNVDSETKHREIKKYCKEFDIDILVETGTYKGDTIEAVKDCFETIYSIELSQKLYEECSERFKDETKINLINGDSSEEIENIVNNLKEPAVFWLDAHYSGGETTHSSKATPVKDELDKIFESEYNNVILIDDARDFINGNQNYPGLEQLCGWLEWQQDNHFKKKINVQIKDDIIRITPQ